MKILLAISASFFSTLSLGQTFTESFDDLKDASLTSTTTALESRGWSVSNLSSPLGNTGWFGNGTIFAPHSGAGYVAANYQNVKGSGTISNWIISPMRTFRNGDTISFWTRTSTGVHPDRLELRLSKNGTSTNIGTGSTSFGDFSTTLATINPNQLAGDTNYPTTWTLNTITVSGVSTPTSGRFAFRYFVTGAGGGAARGEYIGLDDVTYTPTDLKPITGTLVIPTYTGSFSSLDFYAELRDVSTNALIETIHLIGFPPNHSIFFFTRQPAGTYRLRLRGANRFLAYSQTITIGEFGVSGLTSTHANGDCNGDNVVGTADFNILRAAWGAVPTSSNWNVAADLNGDEVIGIADFNIMRANWGGIGDN